MKLRVATLTSIIVLTLCSVFTYAQIQKIPDLSADLKWTNASGGNGSGKVFFSNQKLRIEMTLQNAGPMGDHVVMISDYTNPQATSSLVLLPENKMFMQFNSNNPGMKRTAPQIMLYDYDHPCQYAKDETCTKVGTETVNGYACDKWKFTGKDNSTVWISQKLHFPIKSVTDGGTSVEFSNIKEGSQSSGLFTVPPDYTKFDPMAMSGRQK